MATNPNFQRFQQQLRQAQRQLEQAARQADAHNRRVVAEINAYNRKAADHNNRVVRAVNAHNQQVNRYNQATDARNRQTINALNQARRSVTYTAGERSLVDRVRESALNLPFTPETDVFVSYAQLDGEAVGGELREHLEELGVATWFAPVSLKAGVSMARQLDQGLAKSRAGAIVLTPAYLAGRFWTERELGALLHKATVIPILHGVTFDQVAEYSGILPDLFGFTTARDDVATIAAKIADAVRPQAA